MRKLLAESNDSETGGGARDLRFPARAFDSKLRLMFPTDAVGRNGREIRIGNFLYPNADGGFPTTQLDYWPPTHSRPAECRIARIHASPALGGQLPRTDKGRVFVLLTQFSNGAVRCDYAYEDDLRAPGVWAHEVSSAILGCVASACVRNATRTTNLVPAVGYYDFTSGTGYCHAD